MGAEHRERVENLAWLKWMLLANESAREKGLITDSMYGFAKKELQRDIGALEAICYNVNYKGDGGNGIKACAETA